MMDRAAPLLVALLAAVALGCAGDAAGPSPGVDPSADEYAADSGPDEAVDPKASEIDQLRGLPYLNYSPDRADPAKNGIITLDERRAWPGYSLFTLRAARAAELIDLRGQLVNRWSWHEPGHWSRNELLPNGDLLAVGSAPESHYLLRLTFDGEPVWKRDLPAHHDVEQTPSGDILVISQQIRTETIDGEQMRIKDDLLVLLDPDGKDLATVSLYDAFRRAEARTGEPLLDTVRTGRGGSYDFFHANSVEWMNRPHLFGTHPLYGPRHVLVSIKHQDLVVILDWDRGELIWWWGRGEFDGQHDATLLENGNILTYDNGMARKWGRALEIDPRTGRIVWQYVADPKESLYTRSLGSAQRLPNGNTLIAESERGRALEVTREGDVVWEYLLPYVNRRGHRAAIVRMVRYDKRFIEDQIRAGRRRAGLAG